MAESQVISAADRSVATGVVEENRGDRIVLAIPGTDYKILLMTPEKVATPEGKRISGTIRAAAKRVDVIPAGGRYVEPVMGRPRRVQGRVISVIETEGALVVSAGVPVVCKLGALQKASDFKVGQMVSMNVAPDATFTPRG
ncbi:MAG: hypothetical protein VYC34_10995 [Planctomycetota bacterium]|nr:hypothetical protein [Planctomycetota bacterium]